MAKSSNRVLGFGFAWGLAIIPSNTSESRNNVRGSSDDREPWSLGALKAWSFGLGVQGNPGELRGVQGNSGEPRELCGSCTFPELCCSLPSVIRHQIASK